MSLLISLKQRIKVIETIRKTTHAMRLISMSNNSRLRNKKAVLETYQQEIVRMTALVKHLVKMPEPIPTTDQTLLIIAGAQKGLCGTFNINLLRFIEQHFSQTDLTNYKIIALGKQLIGILTLKKNISFYKTYPLFNQKNFITHAHALVQEILTLRYKNVIVIGNLPKTFFIQLPQKTVVFPLQETVNVPVKHDHEINAYETAYEWEGDAHYIAEYLTTLHLQATVEMLLFQSLLAEQAARFISMNAATHNAENVLDTMKLDYNKLRQATITRELSDLTAGLI